MPAIQEQAVTGSKLLCLNMNGGLCRELLAELQGRVRRAIALPVRIAVKDVYDETCTELLISAPLDSGVCCRPRLPCCQFSAVPEGPADLVFSLCRCVGD